MTRHSLLPLTTRQPRSVEELTQTNVETIARLEDAARSERSRIEQLVLSITGFCGRIVFAYLHIAWFAVWIGFNTLGPRPLRFDVYPFTLLTMCVSLEAILLSVFILNSQRHAARLDERRNQLELQVALLSEQENTKMLKMLEAIAVKVGADVSNDPEIAALQGAARPETLIEQIQAARTKR